MEFFEISRKEKMGVSLAEAMGKTATLCKSMKRSLKCLEPYADKFLEGGETFTVDDFFLFPILRSLTLVKALDMPEKLERYVGNLSRRCGVPIYSDRAI